MKPKLNKPTVYFAIGIALVAFVLGRLTSSSEPTDPHLNHDHSADSSSQPTLYSCAMHPQITQPTPGDCPICGMDLTPVGSHDNAAHKNALTLSESAKAIAQIQTSRVERRFPIAEVSLVGHIEYDETKIKSITARFPARIDELYVNFTGVPVNKGDELAQVYSPELLTAQSELLAAHRYDAENSKQSPAYEKLLLWGLLPEQIDAILTNGKAQSHLPIIAPISGVVVSKKINEGDYLATGQALFTIVDLDQLWLKLEAYESDLAWLRYGQEVSFTVEAYPSQAFQGRIIFIDPELDRSTRTLSIRANIPNTHKKLKPGMLARASIQSRIAQAGKVFAPEFAGKWISPMHPEIVKDAPGLCDICGMDLVPAENLGYVQDTETQAPLLVPSSAVLRTGTRSLVYVQIPNTEEPTYEAKEIEIGQKASGHFIVETGLIEGDLVVTHGAFKIDSALQIQAKPSMMNPQGGAVSQAHDHSGEHSDHIPSASLSAIELPLDTTKQILPIYFSMQTALAKDNLPEAKSALSKMMTITGHSGPLPDLIHTMLATESLDAIRRPHFETLSKVLIQSVSKNPDPFTGNVYRMNCSMVYPDRGADWLQNHSELLNPYWGSAMLQCGTTEEKY